MAFQVRALGEREVILPDGKKAVFPVRTAENLFWYLLLFPEGRAKDLVISEFLDSDVTTKSLTLLRVTVHRVRRALGDDSAILSQGDRLALAPHVLEASDTHVFSEALSEARLASSPEDRMSRLELATKLAAGPFVPGLHAEWADEARREFDAARAEARLGLAAVACEMRRCSDSVDHLSAAIAVDPLIGEEHEQQLLICLTTTRGSSCAVDAYRQYVKALRDEIDEAPAPETDHLITRIRSGEAVCDAAPESLRARPL